MPLALCCSEAWCVKCRDQQVEEKKRLAAAASAVDRAADLEMEQHRQKQLAAVEV